MEKDTARLKLIALVIFEAGFTEIENEIRNGIDSHDALSSVSENAFENGKLVGFVIGQKSVLKLFDDLRDEIKTMKDEQ